MDPSDTRNAYFDPGSVTGDFPVEDGLETVTVAAPTGGVNWWLVGAVLVAGYFLMQRHS